MPLLPGKKNIGHNVKVEERAGKPVKVATAIALSKAGEGKDDKFYYSDIERMFNEAEACLEDDDKRGAAGLFAEALKLAQIKNDKPAITEAKQGLVRVKDALPAPVKVGGKDYSDAAQKPLYKAKLAWQSRRFGDCIDAAQDAINAGADGEDLREANAYIQASRRMAAVKSNDSLPTPVRVAGAARDAEPKAGDRVIGVGAVMEVSNGQAVCTGRTVPVSSLKPAGKSGEWNWAKDSTTQYATPPRKPHVLTSVALPNPVDVAKAYAPHKAEEFKKTFGKDSSYTTPTICAFCRQKVKADAEGWMAPHNDKSGQTCLGGKGNPQDPMYRETRAKAKVKDEDMTPQDNLQAAQEHEVAGNRHSALDHYKQARAAATDSSQNAREKDRRELVEWLERNKRILAKNRAAGFSESANQVLLNEIEEAENELKRTQDSVIRSKAEDGIAACQGYFARCADAAKYTHPEAGKTKKYASRAKALDAAVMRTRAGERVTVRGCDVMPTKDARAKDDATGNAMNDGHLAEIKKAWNSKIYAHYRTIYNAGGKVAADKYLQQFTTRKITDTTLSPVRVGGRDGAAGDVMEGPYDIGYQRKGTPMEARDIVITASSWDDAMKKAKAGIRSGEELYRVSPRDKSATWAQDSITPVRVGGKWTVSARAKGKDFMPRLGTCYNCGRKAASNTEVLCNNCKSEQKAEANLKAGGREGQRGDRAVEAGNFKEAIKCYERARDLCKSDPNIVAELNNTITAARSGKAYDSLTPVKVAK